MYNKSVIFMVTSIVAVALLFSSISTFNTYAVPPDPGYDSQGTCGGITTNPRTGNNSQTCCWTERVPGKLPPSNKATYCQTCEFTAAGTECKPKQQQIRPELGGISPEEQILEQPPISQPSDPFAPLQDGVLEQPTISGEEPPITGQQILPQDELVQQQEQPPVEDQEEAAPQFAEPPIANDEESQPQAAEPVCPQNQIFDEELGLCILKEPEDQSSDGEEQQSSEEDNGSDENNN